MAMLAKQAWRLIHSPDSLCAKLLKAKYYLESDILKVEPTNNMSYTWRSILKRVEVLKNGIIWRIGDGNNINIWQDLSHPLFRRKPSANLYTCQD
jgi:hypothetical protein